MRRIQSACLNQTIHFQLKEAIDHEEAVRIAEAELAHYKRQLEHKHIRHRIVSEERQSDGSIVIRIIKQYIHHSVGDYLD